MKPAIKALIVVDIQKDFCPGGSLAVNEGDKIVVGINDIMAAYDIVVATQDWHPVAHKSFALNNPDTKEFQVIDVNGIQQVMWPIHCVQGQPGSDFHRDLNLDNVDMILHKGTNINIDSYSAFLENDHKTKTGLKGYLKEFDVEEVYVCGLATDYCVFYTAMDALQLGFKSHILLPLCRGISQESVDANLDKFARSGGIIL